MSRIALDDIRRAAEARYGDFTIDLPDGSTVTLRTPLRVSTTSRSVAAREILNDTADRLYTATARSAPGQAFSLPPGPSVITFRAAEFNPFGALTVLWRSAYW